MPACSQARRCSEPVGVSVRAFWGLARSSPAPFLPTKAVVCWARMEKPRGGHCSASNRTRRGLLSKAVVKGRTQTEALVQMAHNTDTRHRPPCFQGCLTSFLEGWRCRVVAERFLVPVSSRSAKQRDKAGRISAPGARCWVAKAAGCSLHVMQTQRRCQDSRGLSRWRFP